MNAVRIYARRGVSIRLARRFSGPIFHCLSVLYISVLDSCMLAANDLKRTIILVGASGYIGSRLSHEFKLRRWSILGCDLRNPAEPGNFSDFYLGSYTDLPDNFIENCDAVLWFAGHSSVRLAEADRWGSLENNVFDLAKFLQRVDRLGKPIVYASSASVLSTSKDSYSLVADEVRANAYDAGKLAFDIIAPHCHRNAVALRMATVCGWSPHMRWDIVFNAMNQSAANEKVVRVVNASNFRSLLFFEDLSTYLVNHIEKLANGDSQKPAQVVLGSWSGTIGLLAAEIADFWHVPIAFGQDTGTYSFVLNDRALRSSYENPSTFYRSVGQCCALFAQQNDWMAP